MSEIHDEVRERYAAAARAAAAPAATACCGPMTDPGACDDKLSGDKLSGGNVFGSSLYDEHTRAEAPEAARASLGCGNPVTVAQLNVGETVLDLGSGAGLDVILSARRVGPDGTVYGLDMTEEMLELARSNVATAGVDNVTFLHGTIEDIPLPDASVDVVISNCVINLAPDKSLVFAEIARVLRSGGRVGVTDVVADDALTQAERSARGSFVECIAGALSFAEYRAQLEGAGLHVEAIEPTHAVADGLWSAIVRATKLPSQGSPV